MSCWAGKSVRSSKVRARGLKAVKFGSQSFVCELKHFKPNGKGIPGQFRSALLHQMAVPKLGQQKLGALKA